MMEDEDVFLFGTYLDTLFFFSPVRPPLDLEPWLTPPEFSSGSSRYRGPRLLPDNRLEKG